LAFQRERIRDDRPHGAHPVRWRNRQPEIEIDLVHLLERVSDTARPLRASSGSATRRVVHGERLADRLVIHVGNREYSGP